MGFADPPIVIAKVSDSLRRKRRDSKKIDVIFFVNGGGALLGDFAAD